jgi:hypothetical protein
MIIRLTDEAPAALLIGIFITLLGSSIQTTNPSNVFAAQQSSNSINGYVSTGLGPIPDLQVELLNDV